MKTTLKQKVENVKTEIGKAAYTAKWKVKQAYFWTKDNVTMDDIAKGATAAMVLLKTVDKAAKMVDEHRSSHRYYDRGMNAYVHMRRQPNAKEAEMIRQMHEEGSTYADAYRALGLIK